MGLTGNWLGTDGEGVGRAVGGGGGCGLGEHFIAIELTLVSHSTSQSQSKFEFHSLFFPSTQNLAPKGKSGKSGAGVIRGKVANITGIYRMYPFFYFPFFISGV